MSKGSDRFSLVTNSVVFGNGHEPFCVLLEAQHHGQQPAVAGSLQWPNESQGRVMKVNYKVLCGQKLKTVNFLNFM